MGITLTGINVASTAAVLREPGICVVDLRQIDLPKQIHL
jgi:hypothetical protein